MHGEPHSVTLHGEIDLAKKDATQMQAGVCIERACKIAQSCGVPAS